MNISCASVDNRSTHSNDLGHFRGFDGAITIDVIHMEGPVELLLGVAGGCNVDGEEKFTEVDLAALIRVERAEDVLAEALRITLRKE